MDGWWPGRQAGPGGKWLWFHLSLPGNIPVLAVRSCCCAAVSVEHPRAGTGLYTRLKKQRSRSPAKSHPASPGGETALVRRGKRFVRGRAPIAPKGDKQPFLPAGIIGEQCPARRLRARPKSISAPSLSPRSSCSLQSSDFPESSGER